MTGGVAGDCANSVGCNSDDDCASNHCGGNHQCAN
jgi:hypothetical protein